ncbi:MAG: hypothetical protein LBL13_05295 [Bacteroidales bacterium]|jgi:hypothetical protein|nr:hypothetical protein [Bacteroidales bacterium]
MTNLSLKNRVSLTRKSEDLIKVIEDLSSNYQNRENFFCMPQNNSEIKTSEICTIGFICVAYVAGLVAAWLAGVAVVYAFAGALQVGACKTEFLPCNDYAMVDSVIYKNVV